jgi:hypothetical protein
MSKAKNRQRIKINAALTARTQFLDKTAEIFFILVLAVFPLYLNSEKYVGLTSHKAKFFWVICGLTLLAAVCCILTTRPGSWSHLKELRLSAADWAILAFWLFTTLSALASPNQDLVWFGADQRNSGWITTTCYVMAYFLISRCYVPRERDSLIFAGGSIILCAIGILQFYGIDPFSLFPYERFVDSNGAFQYSSYTIFFRTTLGNVDVVSAYVSMALLFFGALYVQGKNAGRFVYLTAAVLNFWLMLMAGADSGKVAVTAAMILLLPYWLASRQSLGRTLILVSGWGVSYGLFCVSALAVRARLASDPTSGPVPDFFAQFGGGSYVPLLLGFTVLALLGAALIIWGERLPFQFSPRAAKIVGATVLVLTLLAGILGVEILGARYEDQPQHVLYQAREVLHGRPDDDFGTGRVFVWRSSLSVVPEHPFLGTGPDTFDIAFTPFQAETQQRYNLIFDKAHNDYVQILVCCGIPALIAYLALLLCAFIPAIRKAFDSPLLFAALGAGLSYCVQSFFGVDVPIATPLFWLILGLAAQASLQIKRDFD